MEKTDKTETEINDQLFNQGPESNASGEKDTDQKTKKQAPKKRAKKKNKDNQVLSTLTSTEQAIASRVQAETDEWEPIDEGDVTDFSLMYDFLDLKHHFPEAWDMQDRRRKFAFRWCERTDKRIDELTKGGHPLTQWKICTLTTTPFLKKYIDPSLGCIKRLDQILLFRPYERHRMEMDARRRIVDEKVKSERPEELAMRRTDSDNIHAFSGPKHKIGSNDEVQYEDNRELA